MNVTANSGTDAASAHAAHDFAATGGAQLSDQELEVLYAMAYRLDATQMHAEAYGIFATLLLFRPRSVRYLKAAGICLMSMRRYACAILPLSVALLLDDDDATLALACGECLAFLGGAPCTNELFRRAATLAEAADAPAIVERARAWLDNAQGTVHA